MRRTSRPSGDSKGCPFGGQPLINAFIKAFIEAINEAFVEAFKEAIKRWNRTTKETKKCG